MDRPDGPPRLELRSISFSYDGARSALDDVSLEVWPGQRVAVLGHNGSGKSTLVKIAGALQAPSQGACLIDGRDVREIPFHDLRRRVGVLFQDPEAQLVGAVVEDDVAFAPEGQGLPPHEILARVERALAQVGMLHKRRELVAALSGGEKQRVAIAGVLAAEVGCLILDEPTAMLDPEGRIEVDDVLRSLHASGAALVQVTHQLEGIEDADRALVLSGGRIVWQGATQDLWGVAEEMGFELPPLRRAARRSGIVSSRVDVADVARAVEARLSDRVERGRPPTIERPTLIEARGLSFRFDAASGPTLIDVDADVPKGGWLSIVGRTGSGKSTFVQHLNALHEIQVGEILMEGAPLPQKGPEVHALRQRVGLVFQSPEDQLFCPTVREELAFAPANAGLVGDELERAILWAMDEVGIDRGWLERAPLALSGGERRLVAIASVLSALPECLVLDEPTAGLDARHRRRILDLLGRLRDEGRTVVVISHDMDMALRHSDRLLVLGRGRRLGEGGPHEILPALMEALRPEAWPIGLQIAAEIRRRRPDAPLAWDVDEL